MQHAACATWAQTQPLRRPVAAPQVYNAAKARVAGSGAEALGGAGRKADDGKARGGGGGDAKWKSQSESLRAAMEYNRKLAKAEKEGIDISTLGPPPRETHDDRVECPHCGRKFNSDVAARHIPKCNARPK